MWGKSLQRQGRRSAAAAAARRCVPSVWVLCLAMAMAAAATATPVPAAGPGEASGAPADVARTRLARTRLAAANAERTPRRTRDAVPAPGASAHGPGGVSVTVAPVAAGAAAAARRSQHVGHSAAFSRQVPGMNATAARGAARPQAERRDRVALYQRKRRAGHQRRRRSTCEPGEWMDGSFCEYCDTNDWEGYQDESAHSHTTCKPFVLCNAGTQITGATAEKNGECNACATNIFIGNDQYMNFYQDETGHRAGCILQPACNAGHYLAGSSLTTRGTCTLCNTVAEPCVGTNPRPSRT